MLHDMLLNLEHCFTRNCGTNSTFSSHVILADVCLTSLFLTRLHFNVPLVVHIIPAKTSPAVGASSVLFMSKAADLLVSDRQLSLLD